MKDREKWLSERRKGIGGSDIGTILGVNPYETKHDLALRKLGMLPEKEATGPMQRGTRLEPLIADIFTETTGIEVVEEKQMLVHPKHSWMLGNIDRRTMPEKAVLEIKAPGMAVFSKIRREGLPETWRAQLEWYLSITGSEVGFFAVFNSELWKLEHYQIQADTEFQELMIGEAEKFWRDLQQGIIPEEENGPVIELPPTKDSKVLTIGSPEWKEAITELQEAEEILKEAEELKESAKDRIKNLMGAFDIAEGCGIRVYNSLQNGRTSIDSKRLKKDLPDIYAKYSKTGTPFRSFKTYMLKGAVNE